MNYPSCRRRCHRRPPLCRGRYSCKGVHYSHGLTILELLVVISIIGVLSAVLIPVMGHARGAARSTLCISNMRQIGSAIHTYADEHNDIFPTVRSQAEPEPWTFLLAPYLNIADNAMGYAPRPRAAGALICPDFDDDAQRNRLVSYAYNKYITRGQWNHSRLIVSQPARTFLVVEVHANIEIHGAEGLVSRHPSSHANFLFVDGHVESIALADADDSNPHWRWW